MTIKTIKLSLLRLSPLNVRRVKPADIEALADDIAAHGLIQNLGAYEEDGQFQVYAGGRRYRALQLLKKRKIITASFLVPIDVRTKEEAVELSLSENFQREKMHPADMVRAFASLRDGGMSSADIALRFGQSEGYVRKLLSLGSLAPALLDAFGKDDMSLQTAQALTITEDHAVQIEAFKACGDSAHSVRRFLTSEKLATTSGLFKFVTRDAYAAAGGTITVDLFSQGDEGFADNAELVHQLAEDRLAHIAAELQAEGWHTVEVTLERPDGLYNRAYLYPARREPTEAEAAALAQIEADIDALSEDDDDAYAALEERRDAINASLRGFTAEQKAIGGVAAYIDYHGKLAIQHYRAKAAPKAKDGVTESDARPALYSAPLIEDLTRIRTKALQAEVASNPALALDILLDTLAAQLLHGSYSHAMAATIRPERAMTSVDDELMTGSSIEDVEAIMTERFADLPVEDRFASIGAMEQADKLALLAGMVALTLDGTLARGCHPGERHHTFEAYAGAAGLDMTRRWQAPVAFFDRLKKSALLAILEEACGTAAADNCAKLKKGELAVAVAERLPADWLPSPLMAGSFAADESDEVPEQPEDEGEMSEAA